MTPLKLKPALKMQPILTWVMVLLVLCAITTGNQVPQRESAVIEVGKNVIFYCDVSQVPGSIWLFNTGTQIAQSGVVFLDDQYALDVLDGGTRLALTVLNAEEEDEGLYACQDQGTTVTQFDLTIEVPASLRLITGDDTSNGTLNVTFTEKTSVQCVAKGSKPSVSLTWEVDGDKAVGEVTTNTSMEGQRIIISTLQYIPNLKDTTLACVTSGQQAISSQRVEIKINVMYAPTCSLLVTNGTTNEFRLFCKCKANPPASSYAIYVNNTLHSTEKEVLISSQKPAEVFCNASNIIGTDTTDPQELGTFQVDQPLPNTQVGLIVALTITIPAVILIGVIVFYHRRKLLSLSANVGGNERWERTKATVDAASNPNDDFPPEIPNEGDGNEEYEQVDLLEDGKNDTTNTAYEENSNKGDGNEENEQVNLMEDGKNDTSNTANEGKEEEDLSKAPQVNLEEWKRLHPDEDYENV